MTISTIKSHYKSLRHTKLCWLCCSLPLTFAYLLARGSLRSRVCFLILTSVWSLNGSLYKSFVWSRTHRQRENKTWNAFLNFSWNEIETVKIHYCHYCAVVIFHDHLLPQLLIVICQVDFVSSISANFW